MPYRIKAGQEILVVSGLRLETKILKRSIDFLKQRLRASPLEEHRSDGIPRSVHPGFPWGFDARELWADGPKVTAVYAKEVHQIAKAGIPKDAKTVVVKGSGTNEYTLELNDKGKAITCTCQGFRFSRSTCKHIKKYNA